MQNKEKMLSEPGVRLRLTKELFHSAANPLVQAIEQDGLYYLQILVPFTEDPTVCKFVESTTGKVDEETKKNWRDANLKLELCNNNEGSVKIKIDKKPVPTGAKDGGMTILSLQAKVNLGTKIPGTGSVR